LIVWYKWSFSIKLISESES